MFVFGLKLNDEFVIGEAAKRLVGRQDDPRCIGFVLHQLAAPLRNDTDVEIEFVSLWVRGGCKDAIAGVLRHLE